jgi:hypothetical protein
MNTLYYVINAHNRDGNVKIRARLGIQRGALELQLKINILMRRPRTRWFTEGGTNKRAKELANRKQRIEWRLSFRLLGHRKRIRCYWKNKIVINVILCFNNCTLKHCKITNCPVVTYLQAHINLVHRSSNWSGLSADFYLKGPVSNFSWDSALK